MGKFGNIFSSLLPVGCHPRLERSVLGFVNYIASKTVHNFVFNTGEPPAPVLLVFSWPTIRTNTYFYFQDRAFSS